MRLRQAYAMFRVAELLAAAGIGDGFEGYPQDVDDRELLGNGEADDYLCIWTDITDPDTPGFGARHYEVNLRAVPGSFDLRYELTYGMGPVDDDYAVLLADVVSAYVPQDDSFQHEASHVIAGLVFFTIEEHEAPFVAEYQRRIGGAA